MKLYRRQIARAMGLCCALLSLDAAAGNSYPSLDPRTLAMGGTGVASASGASVPFMNPALLAIDGGREEYLLAMPLGQRIADPNNLADEIDRYQDNGLESDLANALAEFKSAPTDKTKQTALDSATRELIIELRRFNYRPIEGDISAGFVLMLPKDIANASLMVNVSDTNVARVLNAQADIDAYLAIREQFGGTVNINDPVFDVVISDPGRTIQSKLEVRSIIVSEVGISFAKDMELWGESVKVGVTPKYMTIATYESVTDIDIADIDSTEGEKDYSAFNADIGVLKDFGNGWKVGAAVKNLLSQDYETVLHNHIEIKPLARIGFSHQTDWTTYALDLDLNESPGVGVGAKSQYLAFGIELDIFEDTFFRIGYRQNMANSYTSGATAGVGFDIWGAQADISAYANEDEISYAFQLGFEF